MNERSHIRVPNAAEIAQIETIDELNELRATLADEHARLSDRVTKMTSEDPDRRARTISAIRVFEAGLRNIKNEIRRRTPEVMVRTLPVTDVESAFAATKAINRLLDAFRREHDAMTAWLAAEDDEAENDALDVLEAAHDAVSAMTS